MAIRFHCASCRQPIEVDDEWALKAVACPYCRKTVIAPAESTLGDLSGIPVASPLGAVDEAGLAPPQELQGVRGHRPNRFAVAALALAALAFLSFIMANVVASDHVLELEEFAQPGMTPQQQIDAFSKFVEDNGGKYPTWFWTTFAMLGLSCVTWPIALTCGIIGVMRQRQRGLAIVALVICGAQFALFLCSGVAQLALG
jgi:hypothetical protein